MYWEGEQELPVNFEIVSRAPERARAVLHQDICALDSSSENIFPGCCPNIRLWLAAQREHVQGLLDVLTEPLRLPPLAAPRRPRHACSLLPCSVEAGFIHTNSRNVCEQIGTPME